jgi:SAM-dependent methyltransferase
MPLFIDALTSPTLKHLRERWWNDEFTEFLTETLRPRAGNRILDIGCGRGTAEVKFARLHLSQLRLFGVDLVVEETVAARKATASHNQRAGFAAADACRLPFPDNTFDSTFCVAVLQHIRDVNQAIKEFVRVTAAGGRIVAVEPDNGARYWYSSTPSGMRAFDASTQFFASLGSASGESTDGAVGPKLPTLFAAYGIEPVEVRLFPVSQARLGAPPEPVWRERLAAVQHMIEGAPTQPVRTLGREYIAALESYAHEATAAGPAFVEIQNTMLFATVGQKTL